MKRRRIPLARIDLHRWGAAVPSCHSLPSLAGLFRGGLTRHPLTLSTQVPLLHLEQFYIKDERRIRRNCPQRAPLAIA
jgi:hypothetical protein